MADRIALNVRVALLAAIAGASILSAGEDPSAVLSRATAKMLEAGQRMPRYTCVETVTRETYLPAATLLPRACSVILEQRQHPTPELTLRLFSTDRLRLDVAMVARGEIFSWVGASRFNDAEVDQLVRNGPMGTGAFGAFLGGIFRKDTSHFKYLRSFVSEGRSLMEYAYEIPAAESTYKVKLPDAWVVTAYSWVVTAYSGTVQIDPATSDVVRLAVQTAEFPQAVGSCMSATTMDYASMQIGSDAVPLPVRVSQRWVAPDGREAENTTAFTSCREYRGESTVTYDTEPDAAPGGGVKRVPESPAAVVVGLRFTTALSTPIDTATAAAGDPFRATLTEPLRDRQSKVLAPKGTVVEGRLLRVEVVHYPPFAVVSFKLETLRVPGAAVALSAVRDFDRVATGRRGVEIVLPEKGEEYSAVFQFRGPRIVVPKGFLTNWRTVTPAPANSKR